MTFSAGSVSGNIELIDSALQSGGTVMLKADAGHIQHGGGVIRSAELDGRAASGIRANTAIGTLIGTVSGSGDIEIVNSGDLTVTEAHAADGDVVVENFGSVTALTVRTLGSSADNNIVLTTHALGASNLLTFNEINAGSGAGSVTLNAAGTIVQTGGPVVADQLNVIVGGGIALATHVNSLDLRTTAPGDVSLTDTNDAGLRLGDVQVLNGSLSVSASGSIVAERVRSLSNLQGNDIVLTSSGGSLHTGLISAGVFAATQQEATELLLNHSLGKVTLSAAGVIDSLPQQQGPALIADQATLIAGQGINNLLIAVNMIHSARTSSGSISLTNVDGVGEESPGLTVIDAATQGDGSSIVISAQGDLSVDKEVKAEGADSTVRLEASGGNLWIGAGTGKVAASGGIALAADGAGRRRTGSCRGHAGSDRCAGHRGRNELRVAERSATELHRQQHSHPDR